MTSEEIQDSVNTHATAAGHGCVQVACSYMLCPVNIGLAFECNFRATDLNLK